MENSVVGLKNGIERFSNNDYRRSAPYRLSSDGNNIHNVQSTRDEREGWKNIENSWRSRRATYRVRLPAIKKKI